MDDTATAIIIPFPGRRRSTSELGQSAERLTSALGNLSTALTQQRAALNRWRDSLAELQQRMHSLSGSQG